MTVRKSFAVWVPADIADTRAIQMLMRGEQLDPDTQIRAVKCIVEQLAGTYDLTFDPDSDRISAFAEGRRFVGRALVGIGKLNLDAVKAADKRIAARAKSTARGRKDNDE